MSEEGVKASAPELETWAENQRALARALGLSIEEWVDALARASGRRTGLTAAVVGAAVAQALPLSVLDRLDPPALLVRARGLIDPSPPRAANPILREAIRRGAELGVGKGSRLLRTKAPPARPERSEQERLPSAGAATPDAPGEES